MAGKRGHLPVFVLESPYNGEEHEKLSIRRGLTGETKDNHEEPPAYVGYLSSISSNKT